MEKVALSHLPNPVSLDGREQVTLPYIPGETLGEYLIRAGITVTDAVPVVVYRNDVRVEGDWRAVCLSQGDQVVIRAAVKGKTVAQVVGAIAVIAVSVFLPPVLAAAGFGVVASSLITAAVVVGTSLLVNALTPVPGVPSFSAVTNETKDRYLLSGTRNRTRKFEPLPLVIGRMRIHPDLGSQPYTIFDQQEQYLYQTFHLGLQPELALSDLRIGNAPAGGFNHLQVHYNDTEGKLPELFGNVDTVPGVEIKKSDGWVVRSTAPNTVKLQIDIQGTAFDTDDRGAALNRTMYFDVEVYKVEADGSKTYQSTGNYWLTGDGVNTVRFTHTLMGVTGPGTFEVWVRKTSEDKSTTRGQRKFSWVALRAFQPDNANYTGQRRVGLSVRASGQLSGALDAFNLVAADSIPAWNGIVWVERQTSNPAWWLLWWYRGKRDSLGKRLYGAGLPDSRIDVDSIKAFGAWCERKNLTVNMLVDRAATIRDIAVLIARAGRGEPTWQTGRYGVIWDDDSLSPSAVFGPANIKAGSFKVEYLSGKLADEVVVNFLNKDLNWQPDSVRARVGGITEPDNPVTIDFTGCTDKDQAGREASLMAAAQLYLRRRTSWETDREGLVVGKGDVVRLSHDMVGWSHSGRLVSGSQTRVELDADVPAGSDAYLGLRFPDGRYKTYRVASLDGRVVTPLDAIVAGAGEDPLPVPDDGVFPACDWMWFYDPATSPGRLVKVTDVQALDDNTLRFVAMDYLEAYFEAETLPYIYHPGYQSTHLDLGMGPVTAVAGFSVAESQRYTREGQRIPVGLATWLPVLGAVSYQLRWRRAGSLWQTLTADLPELQFDCPAGEYQASVVATLSNGSLTPPSTLTFTILDAPLPASPVFGFEAEVVNNGVLLRWEDCPDPDYLKTEVRKGNDFSTATLVTEKRSRTHLLGWLSAGSHVFWARHWNVSLPGVEATRLEKVVLAPSEVNIVRADLQANALALGWEDAFTDQPIKSYSISIGGQGSTPQSATFYGKAGADSRSEVVIFSTAGNYRVFVWATDVAGNAGPVRSIDVVVSLPANYSLAAAYSALDGALLTHALQSGTGVLLPVKGGETWQQHFTGRGWQNIQAQVNAGFPKYIMPGESSGQVVHEHDLGKLLPAATLSVIPSQTLVAGSLDIRIDIAWQGDDATWRQAPPGALEVQAANVRRVRVTASANGSGGDDLLRVDALNVAVRTEDKTETGRLALNQADTNGTVFTPSKTWLDIVSAVVTPQNSPNIARTNVIIDDAGAQPVVRIQAWDQNGQRTGGDVSILLGGY
ncbi:host specificity factor TipJ family phage tail protein [Parasalinivibrio latis]|uniref:host specificity protein J n=1 Tax=Parasalinivibrio latis TaxID=2952610 RepID=UPI0030E3F830